MPRIVAGTNKNGFHPVAILSPDLGGAKMKKARKFEYGCVLLQDVHGMGVRNSRTGRLTITAVELAGHVVAPSLCFWKTLFVQFGVPLTMLRFFEPAEVLRRITQCMPNQSLRYCIERDECGRGTILAVCPHMTV